MKKKLIPALLLALALASILCACGGEAEGKETVTTPVETLAPTLEPTAMPTVEPTPEPIVEPTPEPTVEPAPELPQESTAASKPASAEVPESKENAEPITSSVDQIKADEEAAAKAAENKTSPSTQINAGSGGNTVANTSNESAGEKSDREVYKEEYGSIEKDGVVYYKNRYGEFPWEVSSMNFEMWYNWVNGLPFAGTAHVLNPDYDQERDGGWQHWYRNDHPERFDANGNILPEYRSEYEGQGGGQP